MRVLLGLGNAELLEALCRDDLADRALELLGRIGYRQGQRLVILRCADKAQRIHAFFAHKAVKLRQSERPCHLSGAVRAEVHEYHAVALVHDALGAHDDGLNKLVGYVCLVAVLDCLHGVGVHCALAADNGVVACLDSVPALVAIHAVKSALDGRDLRVAEGDALVVELCYILDGTSRRNVASVEEAVDIDLFKAAPFSHVEDRKYVIYMAVYAAVGQKAEDMQRLAGGFGIVHCLDVGRVFKKAAVCYGVVYARQILKHDAACADIRVADLAVAHLPLGQTDVKPGGGQLRICIFGKYAVKVRLFGNAYGVAAALVRYAEAVHDNENALTHLFPPLRR